MNPKELRAALAAKQNQTQQVETPNAIDVWGNEKEHSLVFHFHHPADNFKMNTEQVRAHVNAVIKAAKEVGIKVKQELIWAE